MRVERVQQVIRLTGQFLFFRSLSRTAFFRVTDKFREIFFFVWGFEGHIGLDVFAQLIPPFVFPILQFLLADIYNIHYSCISCELTEDFALRVLPTQIIYYIADSPVTRLRLLTNKSDNSAVPYAFLLVTYIIAQLFQASLFFPTHESVYIRFLRKAILQKSKIRQRRQKPRTQRPY